MRSFFISSPAFILFLVLLFNAENLKSQQQPVDSLGKPYIYYASPLANIAVVPTKEGLKYKGISFVDMERMIRFLMAEGPYENTAFEKVKTVIVDFGVKAADPQDTAKLPSVSTDPVNKSWYVPLPKHYFVILKFYDCKVNQIGTPSFQFSSMLPVGGGIGKFEAFKLMLHEMFMYHFANPDERNIVLKLG